MKLFAFIVFIYSVISQRHPDQFAVNLDLHPKDRYRQISLKKKQYINKFIDHLYKTQKYRAAFRTAKYLSPFLKRLVGQQFYQQCYGIASIVGRHVSELIVFNYMYQLGAYSKFCTSIPVQLGPNDYFLARNLDYGFQQFLANNSVKLTYFTNGKAIYETIGHAGLIGAHTALRYDGYSVTLNERIDKGLHVTLEQIFIRRAQTVPYLIQKTLRSSKTIQEAEQKLMYKKICSPVYYILNGQNKNIIIQRQRIGIKAFFKNNNYMVQTNTDRDKMDPDTRRDIAELKMSRINQSKSISRENVWSILIQPPNMNNLTLITVLLDTSRNYINATVWY